MPKRVQLSRRKGYRRPDGVVYVGRPSKWGNPHRIGEDDNGTPHTPETAVAAYRYGLVEGYLDVTVEAVRKHLRGKDLGCWCELGAPCHADVLLEIANAPTREGSPTSLERVQLRSTMLNGHLGYVFDARQERDGVLSMNVESGVHDSGESFTRITIELVRR
jgi:hypothetical protein